jgi:CheY-like chemotaxis protein
MTAILGYADLLSDAATTAKERDDFIAVIRRNGNHLLQIINDILDLSKIEAGKTALELAPCNLPALISDVASVVRPSAAKRGLALEIEYRGSVPEEIVTDRLRLRQALVNLVGNAVKFTEKGGVTIAVGLLPAGLQGQPALKIDVIDTGIGIAPEVLPSLFQPFVQADASTSRRFGGTGLGLAIIHRLVTLMGGEVHAESTLGRGSAFTLLVPTGDVAGVRMVRGAAEAISPAPDACAGFARELAGVSVLVAEDGHDNQELIRLLLDGAGAAVEIVDNGRLAVEKALSQPFDVVLMDIQMPVMDGYQATRMLRERGYQGPILAITAHAMDCDRRECLAAGCNVHLSKPLDRALLTKTIAEHVRKAPAAPFAGSPVPQEAEPEPVT